MVEVVVPFGGVEPRPPLGVALVQAGDVAVVLGGQVDVAAGEGGCAPLARAPPGCRLSDWIGDLVDGVEAQAVEAILLEPVERVVDEEVAHRPALVGDGGAPGRVTLGWKKSARRALR